MREIQRRMPNGVWRVMRIVPFVGIGVAIVTYPVGASAEDQILHVVDAGIGEIPIVGMAYDATMTVDAGGTFLFESYGDRLPRARGPIPMRSRVEMEYILDAPFSWSRSLLELRRILLGR